MVYISNGQVLDSWNQSPWRLSFITDFFWGIATLQEEEWVESIIFKAPALLQWVVDEEGKRLL